jgi:hypothetical protein
MLSSSVALFWSLFRHEHRWLDVTETRADSVRVIDRQCARCGQLATD